MPDAARQQVEISEALWRVMRERGIEGLTLRAVAAEAGCTTGLVTKRFRNKRELLLHARQMLYERGTEGLRLAAESDVAPGEALKNALVSALAGEGFDGKVWLGFLAAAVVDEEIRGVQISSNHSYRGYIARLVSLAKPEWPAERVDLEATKIVVVSSGLAALSTADPDFYNLERLRHVLDDVLEPLTMP